MFDSAALRARLAGVRDRIARAADRAGRDAASIRLVAVSKTFSPDHVRALADLGQVDFGENKVQEALQKIETVALPHLRWHFIGHLQSNKARKAGAFDAIHSIDSASLLRKVDAAAAEAKRPLEALLQIDLALEPTKHGAVPEDLGPIFAAARECAAASVSGLMLLPPAVDDPNDARPYFQQLRRLRDDLAAHGVPAAMLQQLSMGMSHDFEVAIEEGATLVRVGSALFGERHYPGVR